MVHSIVTMALAALAMMIASISSVDGFIPLKQQLQSITVHPPSSLHGFPRAIHTEFSVEKATPEMMENLGVNKWPTWGTEGSIKYKTGIKSPEKWYDGNELSWKSPPLGECQYWFRPVILLHFPMDSVVTGLLLNL